MNILCCEIGGYASRASIFGSVRQWVMLLAGI